MASNKISDGRADLYLGFDILNATDPKNLDKCHPIADDRRGFDDADADRQDGGRPP